MDIRRVETRKVVEMVSIITNTPLIDFAKNYLQANPKATQQELQVELKNHLQELKKKQ